VFHKSLCSTRQVSEVEFLYRLDGVVPIGKNSATPLLSPLPRQPMSCNTKPSQIQIAFGGFLGRRTVILTMPIANAQPTNTSKDCCVGHSFELNWPGCKRM